MRDPVPRADKIVIKYVTDTLCFIIALQVAVGVRTADGQTLSVMLQNAETVKLVGPQTSEHSRSVPHSVPSSSPTSPSSAAGAASNESTASSSQGEGSEASSGSSSAEGRRGQQEVESDPSSSSSSNEKAWRTLSVSTLKEGDEVFVYRPKSAARHMGHAINEFIHEQ